MFFYIFAWLMIIFLEELISCAYCRFIHKQQCVDADSTEVQVHDKITDDVINPWCTKIKYFGKIVLILDLDTKKSYSYTVFQKLQKHKQLLREMIRVLVTYQKYLN